MQITRTACAALIALGLAARGAGAQGAAAQATPTSQQLAAVDSAYRTLGVLAYPAQGQSPERQQQDQRACYAWARDQTRWDPMTGVAVNADSAAKAAQQQTAQATQGAAVVGGAKGAAGGALIGAAAGDAGKGAAVGAATGAVVGRRQKKKAERQAANQAAGAAAAASNQQLDTFKKAVGTCMQGRGYTFGK